MSRRFSLILSFCLSFLLNQPQMLAADPSSSSPHQLVYLQDGTTLTTYSIDPQTLWASPVGQPFSLPMTTFNSLVPSLNGEFLYIFGSDAARNQHLWVFATDASGVPQSPAVQELNANGLYNFELDPAANFAYVVTGTPITNDQTLYSIQRFTVDSTTGALSAAAVVAKYPLYGPCAPGAQAALGLNGFGANGQKFYDYWFCSYPYDTFNATYYQRTISPTGALGKEVEVFNWDNGGEGFDTVSFSNDQLIDFTVPNDFEYGISSLDIYPIVPNTTTPELQCTAAMLEACGYAVGEIIHPSGKYIFFLVNDYTDQIASIDLAAGKIIDTGNYIPYQVAAFSPDGTLVYALENLTSAYYIQIYGFNPTTAKVTYNGGVFSGPSNLDTFWPVARQ
jgi:hypothetical protein